jgi:HlyD family secretion protein
MAKVISSNTLKITAFSVASMLLLAACSRGNNTPSNANQRTATLAKGTISASVNATGNINPEGEVRLNFQTTGTIAEVKVKQGDKVKKGQLLATLDLTDAQIALAQAQTALSQAKAATAQADIAVANANTQKIIAQASYSRTIEGGVRPGDITAAQAALNAANASYVRATDKKLKEVDIRSAQAALEAAKANYAKVVAGPQREDYAAAEAAFKNAEASLKQAQAGYDRAFKVSPSTITANPAALQLEQATNNYNSAKAQLDKLSKPADNAQVQSALQQVQTAQSNLDRLLNTSADNANAASALQQIRSAQAQLEKLRQPARPYDVEQANAQRDQAATQLKQAEVQRQQADVQGQQAELQVRQAQRRIELSSLTAPIDGTIATVNAKVGEASAGAAASFVLLDDSVLHINVTVDEIDISRIKVGQDVNITLDALSGQAFVGKVDRIAPNSTLVNGVVSYPVRVILTGNTASLKSGMTASTSILLEKRENVLLAPNWAVRRDRKTNKSYLNVKDGDKSNEIEVTAGLRNDQFTEIVSGVSEGQVVVAPQVPGVFGQ